MFYKFVYLFFLLMLPVLFWECYSESKQIYDRETGKREYLNYAIDASEWIISTADSTNIWPDDFKKPDAASLNIGVGVSGKVLFFLELYKSTNNTKYLHEAVKGGEYLLNNIPQNVEAADTLPSRHSFYGGLAGISFTLLELFKATGDKRFNSGSLKCYDFLKETADEKNGKISYATYNDLLNGNAGTGLYFINYYENKNDKSSLDIAEKIAGHLLDNAIKIDSGLTWRYNQEREFILPNFSHGGAGIGFFFSRLYEVTQNKKYLEDAIAATKYLKSIAKQDENTFMVPYGFPLERWKGHYDIGWAHGPAGTARFFYNMWKITGDYEYLTIVRKCAAAIMKSGLPGMPANKEFGEDPFYYDMRFGQASVANFFIDLYYFDNDETYLEYAKLLVDDLVKKSYTNKNGMFWEFDRYAFFENAGEPAQFTGYFYGASGFGSTLLHIDKIINGGKDLLTLPDNPFKFDFETITYKSEDILTITADLYSTGNKNDAVIVLFHRSASSRGQYRRIAPRLLNEGYNVLAVDTRWGGRKKPLRVVDNKTGERYGAYEVIDNYPKTKDKVWPMVLDSYKDFKASVSWVKENNFKGKVFVLGSSITSILVLKLANDMRDKIDGVISYSPGEYRDEDTTMVSRWAAELTQPVLIVSAQSRAEEEMTKPIFESIPTKDKFFFKAEKGFHGSSILLEDENNWKPLLEFLMKYK